MCISIFHLKMAIGVYYALCSDLCEKGNQEQICRVYCKLYGVVQDLTYEHFWINLYVI